MRRVIGICESSKWEPEIPLRSSGCITFEALTIEEGYFQMITSFFEDFAQRDAGISLQSINVLVVLCDKDLIEAMNRTDEMLEEFQHLEQKWHHCVGSILEPGKQMRDVNLILRRRRLFAIVYRLRSMFSEAKSKNYCVVFGSGVAVRVLLGEKLPKGTKEYS